MNDGRKRVIIEMLKPQVDNAEYPAKRALGEKVNVIAHAFSDGHDAIAVELCWRKKGESDFRRVPMQPQGNDVWQASFVITEMADHEFTARSWIDHFATWRHGLEKKFEAGQNILVELADGAPMLRDAAQRAEAAADKALLSDTAAKLTAGGQDAAFEAAMQPELEELMHLWGDRSLASTYPKTLEIQVDPHLALFSSWYEVFPRAAAAMRGEDRHGTFEDVRKLLPEIKRMGFDVLYLPPIHPIGETNRKGKNNAATCEPDDPGSPWAIGGAAGGHKAIHPQLGGFEEFERLRLLADNMGIALALDIAFQCAPDHPYVQEHPEWFKQRSDGSIQYAENPPKKYQDVYPFDFETDDWEALWDELLSIFLFWRERGVKVFRVDNPHTKPLPFWEWCIPKVREQYPETIFLAEAFTRPKVMYRLAKVGFSQSYTYFTWRNTKAEITQYMNELVKDAPRDYFRPNFWPNTPDILPEFLQYGGRAGFMQRLVLAATLSSNYGIYGPAFELCESAALEGKEEYKDSEKYEIPLRNWDAPHNLRDFISLVNEIRHDNPALQSTWNLRFLEADNEFVLFYAKYDDDFDNVILVAVNLDPYNKQGTWLHMPKREFGVEENHPFLVHDLLGDDHFIWHGERNYLELDPSVLPARIFKLKKRLRRETDFDYFL